METIKKYIARQLACPSGISGRITTRLMNILNRKMYRYCSNIISDFSGKRILEIGFGNGYMLGILQKKNFHLYGIEISNDLLKLVKEKLEHNVQLHIGTVEILEFESNFFDVVYTINTFYFWNNSFVALTEIKRTLVKGGLFINICYTKDWLDKLGYTKYEFSKMATDDIVRLHLKSGFKQVDLKVIEPNKSFCIICRK